MYYVSQLGDPETLSRVVKCGIQLDRVGRAEGDEIEEQGSVVRLY